MKSLLFSFFGLFTSLRTAVVLFVLLTADLLIAWYCLVGNATFYEPMNQIGLWRWLTTFGRDEPALSAWFVIFALLLFLLVVNTLTCTCDRLSRLLTRLVHSAPGLRERGVRFRLSIHLVHLAMVLIPGGYLLSYTMSTVHAGLVVVDGGTTPVPGTDITLAVKKIELQAFTGKCEAFAGRYVDATADLELRSGDGGAVRKTVAMNSPVFFGGWSFFMQRFNPRSKKGMNATKYIVVDARRDPGVFLTFSGMVVCLVALCWYLPLRLGLSARRKS